MFFRLKHVGGHHYLQIVENHRDHHRTVQRVLCTLGQLDQLQANERIDVLLRSLSRFGHRYELVEKDTVSIRQAIPAKGLLHHQPPRSNRRRVLASSSGAGQRSSTRNRISRLTKETMTAKCCNVAHSGKTDALRGCQLFEGLDELYLLELSRLTSEHRLRRGEFLFFPGDPADSLYVVASGMLKASRSSSSGKELVEAIFGEGDTVSTITVFGHDPHQSLCQCIKDSHVLQIRRNNLLTFLDQHPEVSRELLVRMLRIGSRRFRTALGLIIDLAIERADYRIARTLVGLFAEFGRVIPLTHREVAELAGTTPETTTRYVGHLRQRGILQSSRGQVVIVDDKQLGLLAHMPLPK